jgi:hypothetical protein
LIEGFSRRVDAATAAMFASASDAVFADLPTVNLTLLTTVFGTVRSVFERNLPHPEASAVLRQLVLMCIAYLEAVSKTPPRSSSAPSKREQTRFRAKRQRRAMRLPG